MQCSDTTQQMVFKIYTKHLACLVFIYNRLYNICFPCTLSPYYMSLSFYPSKPSLSRQTAANEYHPRA